MASFRGKAQVAWREKIEKNESLVTRRQVEPL
jgi:hypothetical protein